MSWDILCSFLGPNIGIGFDMSMEAHGSSSTRGPSQAEMGCKIRWIKKHTRALLWDIVWWSMAAVEHRGKYNMSGWRSLRVQEDEEKMRWWVVRMFKWSLICSSYDVWEGIYILYTRFDANARLCGQSKAKGMDLDSATIEDRSKQRKKPSYRSTAQGRDMDSNARHEMQALL